MVSHLENRVFSRHVISDYMIYQYNLCVDWRGDHYVREFVQLHATPGVTWREIVEEHERIAYNIARSIPCRKYLLSITVPYHYGFVSMSFQAFNMAISGHFEGSFHLDDAKEFIENFAKEMVQSRDFNAENPYPALGNRKRSDYWPQD